MFKIIAAILSFLSFEVNALKIEISQGEIKPDPIAIVDFSNESGDDSREGSQICDIIKTDLELSGLFLPLDSQSFLENKKILATQGPNIKNWNILNTRFLVYGKVSSNLNVEFSLIDVVTGDVMLALTLKGASVKLRQVAHIIADYIYERITNEIGYFNTNIIYVQTSDNKNSTRRKTKLVKIDQDGFNPQSLTDGSELVLTPRYSEDGKLIAYISYHDKGVDALGKSAHVYMMNSGSKARKLMISKTLMKELLKKNKGQPVTMTYAPRFAPDKESSVLAIIIDGKSAIYKINLATNELSQLTAHTDIDTSPCFSNDGQKIVFTSRRSGRESIYVMNSDGSNVKKISTGEGKYSQPVWSPRGDLIAFSKQTGKQFYIGVMKPDGSSERLIVGGYLVEAPCWSSNGRYLTYSMQATPSDKIKVAVVDITGRHIRIIETNGDAAYPAWSPTVKVSENIETKSIANKVTIRKEEPQQKPGPQEKGALKKPALKTLNKDGGVMGISRA